MSARHNHANNDKCRRCIHSYCPCKDAANDNYPAINVYLPQADEVESPAYVQKTARALNELKQEHGLSDQAVPEWVANVLASFVKNGGMLLYRDSKPYNPDNLPDFDLAFGEDIRVSSVRDLLGYAYSPPVNNARIELFSRVRLISTAMLISEHEIAMKYSL